MNNERTAYKREQHVYGIMAYKAEYFPRRSLQMHVTYLHLNLEKSIMCDMFVVEQLDRYLVWSRSDVMYTCTFCHIAPSIYL